MGTFNSLVKSKPTCSAFSMSIQVRSENQRTYGAFVTPWVNQSVILVADPNRA
jgi:hypothetical protein